MTSTAILGQGTQIKVATGTGATKALSAIALGVLTILTSAAHGFVAGDVITMDSGFTGADAATLNGKTYSVVAATTNTFAIAQDTTGLTITIGTAHATSSTFTKIGNCKQFSGFDGQSPEIDVTNFDSTAKEFRLGLQDFGAVQLDVDVDAGDAGIIAVRAARAAASVKNFQIILASGSTPTIGFAALVRKFTMSGNPNDVIKGQIDLRITGAPTFS